MNALREEVKQYVALRRALGFKVAEYPKMLNEFVTFLEKRKAPHITTALALEWAKIPQTVQPEEWARRLRVVRRFAEHWRATDPQTEVPPCGLLIDRPKRAKPHIYTRQEVAQLIRAAKRLPSKTGMRTATYAVVYGFMAVTGLRVSEVIALNREDVDLSEGVLTVRRTKFGKTRIVPLHPSTLRRLKEYARVRDRIYSRPRSPSFFVAERGTRLTKDRLRATFVNLSREIGLRGAQDTHGPRLHDFRHTMAVQTLMKWYREGADVEQQLPKLSTFLGHVHVADTYWYLTVTPELLRLACDRLEEGGQGGLS